MEADVVPAEVVRDDDHDVGRSSAPLGGCDGGGVQQGRRDDDGDDDGVDSHFVFPELFLLGIMSPPLRRFPWEDR